MKLRILQQRFNLVEITLAMAVIGMGVAGVMALMQLGMTSSKNAIGDNYAAEAADQFVTYVYGISADATAWNAGGLTAIPGAKPADNAEGGATPTDIPNTNLISSDVPGLYWCTQGSGDVTDFEAAIRIWQTQITGVYFSDANASEDIDLDYAVKLNVEVSWPVGKPYEHREKRYYHVEVFNRNK